MRSFSRKSLLVVFALEAEAQGLFDDGPLVFCGAGKVNATYHLTRTLHRWRQQHGHNPDLVLNLGSAGSSRFKTGEVVNCTKLVQRDMDITALGAQPYETLEDKTPAVLAGLRFDRHTEGICGSGDSFVTSQADHPWDVVDMEAYALAKVCLLEQVSFGCLKYITDGANAQAAVSWEATLPATAAILRSSLQSFTS